MRKFEIKNKLNKHKENINISKGKTKNEDRRTLYHDTTKTGYFSGATGSNLQKVGMKPGVCPEEWILEKKIS